MQSVEIWLVVKQALWKIMDNESQLGLWHSQAMMEKYKNNPAMFQSAPTAVIL